MVLAQAGSANRMTKGRAILVPRYFEWNKLMAKARNPKPEIRKKSEGRSPKGASSATPAATPTRPTHASPPLGGRSVLRRHADRDRCPLWHYGGGSTGADFGFRASFGFRFSAFGFPSCPHSTENCEQPGFAMAISRAGERRRRYRLSLFSRANFSSALLPWISSLPAMF